MVLRKKLLILFYLLFPVFAQAHSDGCSCGSCQSSSPSDRASTRQKAHRPSRRMNSSNESFSQPRAPKKRKSKKIAKKTDATQSGSKKISDMQYAELEKQKNKLVAKGDKHLAIKYIERMVPLCTDLDKLSSIMLELADLLFDTEHIAKAERLYLEFLNLYPGDEKAEYASYRAIECAFKQTGDFFRDQSKTKEAITLAQEFLSRKQVFTTYTQQVIDILQQCQEKLFKSEMNVYDFYLKRGNMLAAETRLKNIEKEYIAILPEQEPLILMAGCQLAEKKQDLVALAEKKADLEARFPNYNQGVAVAKAETKKSKSFMDKF